VRRSLRRSSFVKRWISMRKLVRFDVVRRKSRKARNLLHNLRSAGAGQSIARHERIGVLSNGKLARFFDGLLNFAALQIRRKCFL